MCLQYKPFENNVGKGQIARNEQFLLFPQCFITIWRTFYFHEIRNCHLQSLSVWKRLKFVVWKRVNPLPNYNNLDVPKMKAFADDKLNVARMMNFLLDREENTGKRRKCWLQALSTFPSVFSKAFSLGS